MLSRCAAGASFAAAAREADAELGGLTAGCNPAHRGAPIAMAASLPDAELSRLCREEAARTHRHPLAGDVSAAVVMLCRTLLRTADWEAALDAASRDRLPPTLCALRTTRRSGCRAGGFAPDALGSAVAFVGAAGSFEEALAPALAFAGAANYCPVLVGAIAGARWGASAIPMTRLDRCEPLERVERAARALATGWCGSQ